MSAERILVIDDSQDIADFLGYTVLPDLGYDSLVAYNGESAFQLIQANHSNIDLILTDLQLPDVNGLELLRRMHKAGHSIPTIVFTAYGSEQIAVDAFRIGVQDYLNKPVEIGQLETAIERALEARRLRKETERLTRELQEQVFWLRELMRVGRSVTSTLEVDEVLRRIVEAGVALTKADEGFIALLDEPEGQLYLRAAKNIDQDRIETTRIPIMDSLVGSVLSSLRPLRTSRDDESGLLKVSTGFLVYSMLLCLSF
jgi:two-component system NtrC family sensor kinase